MAFANVLTMACALSMLGAWTITSLLVTAPLAMAKVTSRIAAYPGEAAVDADASTPIRDFQNYRAEPASYGNEASGEQNSDEYRKLLFRKMVSVIHSLPKDNTVIENGYVLPRIAPDFDFAANLGLAKRQTTYRQCYFNPVSCFGRRRK